VVDVAEGLDGNAEMPKFRFDMLAKAALTTLISGGLMPQARHGARGVSAFAKAGSKFDGTGLAKEQIGHIHVAFDGTDGADKCDCGTGVPSRGPFEES